MPGRDRRGPMGMGPMTGRGAGFCGGGRAFGGVFGRGMGRGMGFGRGMGRGFFGGAWNDVPPEADETSYLRAEAEALKARMESINRRLEELSTDEA